MANLTITISEATNAVLQRMCDEGVGQTGTPDPKDESKVILNAKLTAAEQAARVLDEWAIGKAHEYRGMDLRKVPVADVDALIAAKKQVQAEK